MQTNFFDNLAKVRKAYARCSDPICEKWELTHNELQILHFLADNPDRNRAADIVTYRGLAKSHVSMSIAHLEEIGMLRKETDANDRRTVHLTLTASAAPVIEEVRLAFSQLERQIFSGVTKEELQAFQSLSQKATCNIARMGL